MKWMRHSFCIQALTSFNNVCQKLEGKNHGNQFQFCSVELVVVGSFFEISPQVRFSKNSNFTSSVKVALLKNYFLFKLHLNCIPQISLYRDFHLLQRRIMAMTFCSAKLRVSSMAQSHQRHSCHTQ